MKIYEAPQKQCRKCQEWKSIEEFYNRVDRSDGKAGTCKDCTHLCGQWDNSPRICKNCQSEFIPSQSNQIYCCPQCCWIHYEKEKRQEGRFLILERDEFRCVYCGLSSIEDAAQLHVDHIIPRASGGEDISGNLITSCVHCNLEKSHRLIEAKSIVRLLAEVEKRNLEHGIEPQLTVKL